jgi:hypothetical protein
MGLFKKVTQGDDVYQKNLRTKTSSADVIMWSGSKDSQTSYVPSLDFTPFPSSSSLQLEQMEKIVARFPPPDHFEPWMPVWPAQSASWTELKHAATL